MNAPEVTDAERDEQAPTAWRFHHRLCVEEYKRRMQGKAGETLCGRVHTGPPRTPAGFPICPMCADLEPGHRANCLSCIKRLARR